MPMHPQEMLAKEKRDLREIERDRKRRELEEWTHAHDLRFVHVRRFPVESATSEEKAFWMPNGGCTLAWEPPESGRKKDNIIRVSCALCHDSDHYDKFLGRWQSAFNFNQGFWIQIRVPKGVPPSAFLKGMFGVMANGDQI
jgi:hypothetical protein